MRAKTPQRLAITFGYGTSSGAYTVQTDAGTNLTATVYGLTGGTTYYFAVTAYNADDIESLPSDEISVFIPVGTPPVLAPIQNQTVNVLQNLLITNTTTIGGNLANNVTYSLVAAPAGMQIDPASGLVSWTPSVAQGGSVNGVTVQVSDTSTPPLTAAQSFTVTVGSASAFQLGLGSAVAGVGQSGSVALTVSASGPVAALSFTLDAPVGMVSNVTVQALLPSAVVTQNPPGANHSLITLMITGGQTLQGNQAVLQINFSALPGQISTFASFHVSRVSAWLADGTLTTTPPDSSSPLTLVGDDSLLQLQVSNGQAGLTLYGPVGNSYQIQSTTNPAATGGWTNEFAVTMTNLCQSFQGLPAAGAGMKFYRAGKL